VAFFLLYLVSFTLHGHVLPGLVGGALGGVLVYLVFREAEKRSRGRRR
jgi:multisubunit Na+/H+ antiporter MnhB subunit